MNPTGTDPGSEGAGKSRLRLGDALIEKSVLSQVQLNIALEEQQLAHRPLGEILIELGFVRREQIAQLLAEDLGLDFVRARDLKPDPLLIAGLDVDSFARSAHSRSATGTAECRWPWSIRPTA